MRPRTHLWTSTVSAALFYRKAPLRAVLLIAGGVLLDLDHYLIYGLRSGDWAPQRALYYFRYRGGRARRGDHRPRYGSLRSALHNPLLLLPVWLLAHRQPRLRALSLGLSLHLALDFWNLPLLWQRMARARGRCEQCGSPGVLTLAFVRKGRRVIGERVVCRPCYREFFGYARSSDPTN